MPHATQDTPPLKRNDAIGASDGQSIPCAPFIENDNSMKDITAQENEESTSSSALLRVLDSDPCGHFVCYKATPLPPQSPNSQTLIIKTKYGVKAEFTKNGSKVFTISANQSNNPASSDLSLPESESRMSGINPIPNLPTPRPVKARYRYRLLPDWQTSYLWYDITWPENPQDSPAIDSDEIEERYPELFPLYTEWQELQEEVFARHFSGVEERGEERALNTAQLLAWEVDGFLIACWLVAQDEVSAVEYKPGDVAYFLERGNLEGQFQEFIRNRIL